MGTRKDTVVEKGATRKKLKLNKETVKDLAVNDGTAKAVKGAARASVSTKWTICVCVCL